jgi:hypothetical protein
MTAAICEVGSATFLLSPPPGPCFPPTNFPICHPYAKNVASFVYIDRNSARGSFSWLLRVEQVLFGDRQVPAGIGRLRHQPAPE